MTPAKIIRIMALSVFLVIGSGFVSTEALACNCYGGYADYGYSGDYGYGGYDYNSVYSNYYNPYDYGNYYDYGYNNYNARPGAFVGDVIYSLADNYLRNSYYDNYGYGNSGYGWYNGYGNPYNYYGY